MAFGVAEVAGTALGGTNGTEEVAGLDEATEVGACDGDGLAVATGVSCRAVGAVPPQATSTISPATRAAFLMLALTVRPVGSYEPEPCRDHS